MKENHKRETEMSPFFLHYCITDPTLYGDSPKLFEKSLREVLANNQIDIICFRDKQTKDIKPLAKSFVKIAREYKISKVLINNDIQLAQELHFDGVHLTSLQFDKIKEVKSLGLYTLASSHSKEDIEYIKNNGADGVTYSPVFFKEDKGEPKGCEELQKVVHSFQDENFYVFALGGITTKQRVKEVQKTKCSGFASISFFCK